MSSWEGLADLVRDVLTPMIAVDKGQIEWVGVEGDVAEIRLGGACAGCPGQPTTVSQVVLPLLRALNPSIRSVRRFMRLRGKWQSASAPVAKTRGVVVYGERFCENASRRMPFSTQPRM